MNIENNDVHLWFAYDNEIETTLLSRNYFTILSGDEREICDGFHFEKHRRQYIATRLLVRNVLSGYVNHIGPDKWCFKFNKWGKPYIANASGKIPDIRFNVSHCDGLIVMALTLGNDIGVDVEDSQRDFDISSVVDSVLSFDEMKSLGNVENRPGRDLFWDIWTLKESYIKAVGRGLSIPLQGISFDLSDEHVIIAHLGDAEPNAGYEIRFWQIGPTGRYRIALAVRGTCLDADMRISYYDAVSGDAFRTGCPFVLRSSGRSVAFSEPRLRS